MKPAHHRGRYHVGSRQVRRAAEANPLTLCWFCRQPLHAHKPHASGEPARWNAGHTIDGSESYQLWLTPLITVADCERAAAGDWLAPQASTCNMRAGRALQDARRTITTRNWT